MALTKESHIGKGLVGVPALVGVKASSGSDPQMAYYVLDREKASHPDGELVPWSTQVKTTTPAASLGIEHLPSFNTSRGSGHITAWKLCPLVPSLPVSYLPRLSLLLPPMVSRTPEVN